MSQKTSSILRWSSAIIGALIFLFLIYDRISATGYDKASLKQRVELNASKTQVLEKADAEMKEDIANTRKLTWKAINKVDELSWNLKILLESQGLKYKKADE